jgi:hypothetical protein
LTKQLRSDVEGEGFARKVEVAESPVDEFEHSYFGRSDDVQGLDVTVDDSTRVGVLDSLGLI